MISSTRRRAARPSSRDRHVVPISEVPVPQAKTAARRRRGVHLPGPGRVVPNFVDTALPLRQVVPIDSDRWCPFTST